MLRMRPGSPYWSAVFRVNGKLQWHNTKQTGKRIAQAVHDAIHKRIQDSRNQQYVAIALGEKPKEFQSLPLSDAWEKYRSVNSRWSDSGRKIFNHFVEWAGKRKDIADITASTALEFLKQYETHSGSTHNTYKSALSKIWRTLTPYTDIKSNPWQAIINKSKASAFYRPLTDAEVTNILKDTKGFWHFAVIIAYNTGLRKRDILKLKWEHIDPEAIEKIPTKTSNNKKSVYIPLRKEVLKALKSIPNNSPYVFPVESKKLKSGAFDKQFRVILNRLGIVDKPPALVSFRSLRSSFITRMEEGGVSRQVLTGIVGHGSPIMTARYSDDRKSAKAILKV